MNDHTGELPDYSPDSTRLLGLDIPWNTLTEDEQRKFFKSPQRIAAFRAISTTTLPIGPKSDEKRGIVSHILRKRLIAEEILRSYPTVYLGSGDDFEYPLSFGSRHVILVDPILKEQRSKDNIHTRLADLIGETPVFNDDTFEFMFDFGSGKEPAKIELEPRYYHPKVGLILLYASRSPSGQLQPQDDIRSRLVKNGAILVDRLFTSKGSLGMRKTIDVAKV